MRENLNLYLEQPRCLITPGSIDLLVTNAVDGLKNQGLKITILETASGALLSSALTISGSTSIFSKSAYIPIADHEKTQQIVKQIGSTREEPIILFTSGNLSSSDVQVGLYLKNPKQPQIIKKNVNPKQLDQLSSNSAKKQLVADSSLRLLIEFLELNHNNIQFQLREVDEDFQHWKDSLLHNLFRLISKEKFLITFAESATGGQFVNTLTDFKGFEKYIVAGLVVYNTQEKISMDIPYHALERDALYSKITAYELARMAKVFTDSDIAIGLTGLLDTNDTRPAYNNKLPKTVYYSIILPRREPVTNKISIPNNIKTKYQFTRQEMKELFVLLIYQELFDLLKQG